LRCQLALVVAATPEIAAAAQVAIQSCAGNVVLCLNSVGIQVSEAIVSGGIGAVGAVGIGKSVAEATAAKAEASAANAAKNLSSDIGKINAGKFGQLELNSLSKTGANVDPAAKSGNLTVAEGKVVGYQGKGTWRPIYEIIINGEVHRLAITVFWIDDKDPLSGALINGAGSGIGYGVGKIIQRPLENVINPGWKNWEWIDVGKGVSKPLPLNPAPEISGNIGSSVGSEGSGVILQEQIKNQQEQKK